MKFDPIELHDQRSLASNNFDPIILDPIRKGVVRLIRLKDEINIIHFTEDASQLLIQHETDGKFTNLLAELIKEIPIGNRKDLMHSPFRDALFENPENDKAALKGDDYRGLKFVGESGGNIDTIDCPMGHFVFEACLNGTYKETPPREGLPINLGAKICIYKNKETEDSYLVILELAHETNLEGGLIYVYTAREIPTHEIK